MSKQHVINMKLAPLTAALLLAFGSSYAQSTDEVKELTSPEVSQVTMGGIALNGEANTRRMGQYTGLKGNGAVQLDFEAIRRDEETGTWTSLVGRDLGLDTREFSVSQNRQGDWRYGLDYNEIVRNDPYVIHTGMTGIGTSSPVIRLINRPVMPAAWITATGLAASNGVEGHDETLKLKRTALGLSGDKWISSSLQLEVNFRDEDKKGARMFGRVGIGSGDMLATPSTTGAGNAALLLTPEPIDSNIRTLEARLNYHLDKLAVTGGYYASFYTNHVGSLTPVVPNILNRGTLNPAVGASSSVQQIASSAVALPPDNQAHQFYLSGTYAYSDTTRANFKLSYTHATQDEGFTSIGLTPAATAPSSLSGALDTTLLQLGLSMRPIQALSVNATFRFENRADRTEVNVYNLGKVGQALDHTNNWPSGSQQRTDAKVEAVYRMADGYSTLAGVEWERRKYPQMPDNTAIFGTGGLLVRETMDESGVHLGLRKAMSEDLNGALSLEFKQRRSGDDWKTGTNAAGNLVVTAASDGNFVLPDMYMDRDRTKVRANLDWDANEDLSVQMVLEHAQDDYQRAWKKVTTQLIENIAGARTMSMDSLTLDTSYKFSENWRLNGYWTHTENRWKVNKKDLGDDTRNRTDTYGLGVSGKASSRLTLGMGLTVSNDVLVFQNVVTTSNVGGVGNIAGWTQQTLPGNFLPQISYNTVKLDMYSVYAVDKRTEVRVNVAYQEFKSDDWQWAYNGIPFVYSDNTTVSSPNQQAAFAGVAFIRRF